MSFWEFFITRLDRVWALTLEHAWLILVAVAIAIAVGVLVGVLITYSRPAAHGALYFCQVMMTVPSLAMLGLLLPLFGIGFTTGVIALTLYSLLPIVRNTYLGIREINPAVIEAARGMGMRELSILRRIKLPMAFSVIMAGIRTATVMVVGIGAIAYCIGAGGLGEFIFRGISQYNKDLIVIGAVCISLLAILADFLLKRTEKRLSFRS
ncbi:MAG: ABC transporter permease [Candidatus Desulforudis sp.]|nr:ABC transporter permease [Desulforudis sp.]